MAPPLGIWRICGFLRSNGIECQVFDPNLYDFPNEQLARILLTLDYQVVGFSMNGLTLHHDLALVHMAKSFSPSSLLVAGGVEATFNHELIMSASPVDVIILGEGEFPLFDICNAAQKGSGFEGIKGAVVRTLNGPKVTLNRPMCYEEYCHVSSMIPLEDIPFEAYWEKLKKLRGIEPGDIDEQDLREIHSIRLMTLNYCPLKCSFCSYTNFLNVASGKKGVKAWRLPAETVLRLVKKAYAAHPEVRTIIFQDDLFTFKDDKRLKPLCEGILLAKKNGELGAKIEFICSNRVDTIPTGDLAMMRNAGFRLIGYGIESFSLRVLKEFNKSIIYNAIEPVINNTIKAGITPFLNIILSSPESTMDDIVVTLQKVFEYQRKGCETSIYPYVIPFTGAELSGKAAHDSSMVKEVAHIPGEEGSFTRPTKILPKDDLARDFIEELETMVKREAKMVMDELEVTHMPSRMKGLITTYTAAKIMEKRKIRISFKPEDVMSFILERRRN